MRRSAFTVSGRGGFTLAEMLVAMALLAVLAAVVVPNVLNQLNKGEVNRVVSDIKAVGQATQTFYGDVQRWPHTVVQLAAAISGATDKKDIGNVNDIPAELQTRWQGPYLDRGGDVASGIKTGFGATIQPTFVSQPWASGASNFVTMTVSPVQATEAAKINAIVDGDNDLTKGQIRHDDGTKTLTYFAAPIG